MSASRIGFTTIPFTLLVSLFLCACTPNSTDADFRITLSSESLSLMAGSSASVMYSVVSTSSEVSVSVLPADGLETTVKPTGDGKMGEITIRALLGSSGSKSLTVIASDGAHSAKASLVVEIEKRPKRIKSMIPSEGALDMEGIFFQYDDEGRLIHFTGYDDNEIVYSGQNVIINSTSSYSHEKKSSIFVMEDGLVKSGAFSFTDWILQWRYDDQNHLISEDWKNVTYGYTSSNSYIWQGNDCIEYRNGDSDSVQFKYGNDLDKIGLSSFWMWCFGDYDEDDFLIMAFVSGGSFPPRSEHLPIDMSLSGAHIPLIYQFDAEGYPTSVSWENIKGPRIDSLSITYYE